MERNIVNDISTQSIVKQSINNEDKSSNKIYNGFILNDRITRIHCDTT